MVVCLLPSSFSHWIRFYPLQGHIEERARKDSSSERREIGLSVQVYTHRLVGRAWSLRIAPFPPRDLSDFLIVALASDPGGNTSATHTRSF